MSKNKFCPHCGHQLVHAVTEPEHTKEIAEIEIVESQQEQAFIESTSKKIIAEVMEKIRPLLEKLGELNAEQSQATSLATQPQSPEEQLKKLQESAKEKMKAQEQRIANRMRQLQNRISKHKK